MGPKAFQLCRVPSFGWDLPPGKGMSGLSGMDGGYHSWDFTAPSCPAAGTSVGGNTQEWSSRFRDGNEDLGNSLLSSGLLRSLSAGSLRHTSSCGGQARLFS